jgi:pimeloyl-ACP methyl ester carboxylesterase
MRIVTEVELRSEWRQVDPGGVGEGPGVRLHVMTAGPLDGPLVILLHGFPDFWWGWRAQVEPLVAAGFRVVVPDQRGYNLSDKPAHVRDYSLDRLAADVVALMDLEERAQAHIVGHDWGGAVAFWTALKHPERVARLVVLNAPDPRLLLHRLLWSPAQCLRSWYIFLFQLPLLPEWGIRLRNWSLFSRSIQKSANAGVFTPKIIEKYVEAWSRSDALKSMLHWYRALGRLKHWQDRRKVIVPTLVIWGARDKFFVPALGQATARQSCEKGRFEIIPKTTHWVQNEAPERVSKLLVQFLTKS